MLGELEMTGTEIVDALDGWVDRIAGLGAAVVPRLRPGLPLDRIPEIAGGHGFDLSDEVAAVWAWHDGERRSTDVGTPKQLPGLTPRGAFFDLETSLRHSVSVYEVSGDDDALLDPDLPAEARGRLWRREWEVLEVHLLDLVLAARPDGSTDTFRFDPQSGTAWVAHSSLPERIAQWHRHLHLGAWRVEPDGTWGVDADRLPRVDPAASKVEQARQTEIT
ncbi:hypothetical protein [Cellulomonas endometrii]|uniref:hypothetical protein n=1 Tax=Cellulomonas endometrii TaxID=3036301 RepID=UPI0024ACDB3A|nr:hypothetical protein [Cellulomonas endometrii]